jgi:hypothetical protein
VQVFDVNGKLIRAIKVGNADNFILKKESLTAGVYLITVISKKEKVAQGRLIVSAS